MCRWAAVRAHSPPYTSRLLHPQLLNDKHAWKESWNAWEEDRERFGIVSFYTINLRRQEINKTQIQVIGTDPKLLSAETAPHISLPRLRLRW